MEEDLRPQSQRGRSMDTWEGAEVPLGSTHLDEMFIFSFKGRRAIGVCLEGA